MAGEYRGRLKARNYTKFNSKFNNWHTDRTDRTDLTDYLMSCGVEWTKTRNTLSLISIFFKICLAAAAV